MLFRSVFSLRQIFIPDQAPENSGVSQECYLIKNDSKSDLGFNNPTTGEPITSAPNSSYVRWVSECTKKYLNLKMTYPLANSFFSEKIRSQDSIASYTLYANLPTETREEMINSAFKTVYGSDEVFDQFGLMKAADFRKQLGEKLTTSGYDVAKAVEVLMLNLILRDEFLLY